MAFLTAISGSGFGKRFELEKQETVLGRHPECDVTIEVGAVSRQHARIHHRDGFYELEDLKSRNGTFLNGQLVTQRKRLQDGDLIRICDVEYSFHEEPETGIHDSSSVMVDGSSFGVMLVDDNERSDGSNRAVQSKLDIRGSQHGSQLTTSVEARLNAVLEISKNLGRAVQLDEVLPKVLDTLFKIFLQADRAFVVLKSGDELIPRWIKTRHEDQQELFRISRTVMREVMESKEAIISLDATSDERFEMANSISDFRIRSMIVAPLLDTQGEPLGAVQMDTLDSKRQFERGDLEILAGIANQAGVAIENAQLHESLLQQHRVEQDLELARSVQRAFLPSKSPTPEGFEFYDYYRPAEQVGGDFYDYIELADGRLAIIVADVVGHGVAAAMLMAKISADTRFLLASQADPAVAITMLNQQICDLGVERFVTLLCLVLDPASGRLEVVNAGHMPPLWLRADGTLEEPGAEQAGLPVGILGHFEYELASIELEPGSRLVLFTDGIHEAPASNGTMFGLNRLRGLIGEHRDGSLQKIGERIVSTVKRFTEGTQQADDMCLVIIGRN